MHASPQGSVGSSHHPDPLRSARVAHPTGSAGCFCFCVAGSFSEHAASLYPAWLVGTQPPLSSPGATFPGRGRGPRVPQTLRWWIRLCTSPPPCLLCGYRSKTAAREKQAGCTGVHPQERLWKRSFDGRHCSASQDVITARTEIVFSSYVGCFDAIGAPSRLRRRAFSLQREERGASVKLPKEDYLVPPIQAASALWEKTGEEETI
jgi:hypothetical protein